MTDALAEEAKRKAHQVADKLWLENLMKPIDKAYEHLAVIALLPSKCAAQGLSWNTCERLMREEQAKITAIKNSL